MTMTFVVVGLDGSSTSRAAFAEAVQEAEWRGAIVLALHVVGIPVTIGAEYGAMIDIDLLREGGRELLANELAELEKGYEGGFPVPVDSKMVMGHAGVELIKAAEEGENGVAELVVLGSRGLGGFKGLLLGSVTTYAVHHLSTRLLILPKVES